ncbi:hypothetical protein [Proteus phage RP6]|nr:hypothetical protein [Proteus phage RP6]
MKDLTKPLVEIDIDVRTDYLPHGVLSVDIKTEEISHELKSLLADTFEAMVVRLISSERKYQRGNSYQNEELAQSGELAFRIADRLKNFQDIDAMNLIMFSMYHQAYSGQQIHLMDSCIKDFHRGVVDAYNFIDSTCPPGCAEEAFRTLLMSELVDTTMKELGKGDKTSYKMLGGDMAKISVNPPESLKAFADQLGDEELYIYNILGMNFVIPWWGDTVVANKEKQLLVFPGVPYVDRETDRWRSPDCEDFQKDGLVIGTIEVSKEREYLIDDFILSLSAFNRKPLEGEK